MCLIKAIFMTILWYTEEKKFTLVLNFQTSLIKKKNLFLNNCTQI